MCFCKNVIEPKLENRLVCLAARQAVFLAHAKGTKDRKFVNNRLNSLKRVKKSSKAADMD